MSAEEQQALDYYRSTPGYRLARWWLDRRVDISLPKTQQARMPVDVARRRMARTFGGYAWRESFALAASDAGFDVDEYRGQMCMNLARRALPAIEDARPRWLPAFMVDGPGVGSRQGTRQ